MITLNFLWHMHQPDYRHPHGGAHILPWVRLHAVKGYADLRYMLAKYEPVRCVVNFSGVLLEQVACLLAGEEDYFASLSSRPVDSWSPDERKLALKSFFSMNRHTLIRPHQRFHELLSKRDHLVRVDSLDEAVARFTAQELTDLAVWFNLAWIGFAGQKRKDVRELILHGREFNVDDQRQVLLIHREMLGQVLPAYKALADAGQIELSLTPYHHPILPLLCDLAGEGFRNEADPLPDFRHGADAAEHIQRGMQRFQAAFARTPRGVWPAEGSVSDEALHALAGAGLDWAATDQQNLPGKEAKPLGHATPWRWERDGSRITVFFRDTRLSDNIGFEYATWNPALAGGHLVDMAAGLGGQSGLGNPVATIALDGENPWESYQDGGEGFLCALFERIVADQQVVCRTPSEIIAGAHFPPLNHVSSGSWIGGNFNIWTRDPETRTAWRQLAKARRDLIDVCTGKVQEHLLAAEGSDWFWWYGDDFATDYQGEFDGLFRAHLAAAYEAAGRPVPDALFAPIHTERVAEAVGEPLSFIHPVLDGRETTFFEWRGAVRVRADQAQASMARSSVAGGVTALWYGFSETSLYLRLDFGSEFLEAWQPSGGVVVVCFSQGGAEFCMKFSVHAADGVSGSPAFAVDKLAELRIDLDETPLVRDTLAYLWVEVTARPGISQRFPQTGRIPVRIIGAEFASRHWVV